MKLTDISPYTTIRDEKIIFTGDKLVCKIPSRYEDLNLLSIEETLTTVGVFGIEINDNLFGALVLLAYISMEPSTITRETINNDEYIVATLYKGDILADKLKVLQDGSISYKLFNEFIAHGKLPYFVDYMLASKLFDESSAHTGLSLDFGHNIFELLVAHLTRDEQDLSIPYRHTKMIRPGVFIRMKSVQDAPTSIGARLLGSYFNDSLVASLATTSTSQHDIENILRY